MITEALTDLHSILNASIFGSFGVISYLLSIAGLAIILYAIGVFSLIVFSLFRMQNISVLKALHVMSLIEVYGFVCLIAGIILAFKIYGLLIFKLILFAVIVILNGITTTRLIAKTAYFYKKSK